MNLAGSCEGEEKWLDFGSALKIESTALPNGLDMR